MASFSEADTDGSGVLDYSDLRTCLETCPLELDAREVMGLLSAVGMGTPYSDLAAYAYQILQYIAQNNAISM